MPLKHHERLFHSAIHIAIYVSSPYLVALLLHNGVGTELREAYELAAQHTLLLSRGRMPQQFYDGETRKSGESLNDARRVQELLNE